MKVTHAQRMSINDLFTKALRHEFLTLDEGLFLFNNASLTELMFIAHQMRQAIVPGNRVTWQIDRNINITNVCISGCKFCNFHCKPGDGSACLLYTSDAADDLLCVDLGGRRIIKKKNNDTTTIATGTHQQHSTHQHAN